MKLALSVLHLAIATRRPITLDDANSTIGRNSDARLRDRTIVNDRF
jgi:hypothetical protein